LQCLTLFEIIIPGVQDHVIVLRARAAYIAQRTISFNDGELAHWKSPLSSQGWAFGAEGQGRVQSTRSSPVGTRSFSPIQTL
jgi:hypothetical protein